MEMEKRSALTWVMKEYLTPIELSTYKGLNSNVAIILGEIKENVFDRYTERLISVQMAETKKVRWLKLRNAVIKELFSKYGEYVDDWRGKTVRLIVEESKGYEVIGISGE